VSCPGPLSNKEKEQRKVIKLASNDDKAKAIAKSLLNDYQTAVARAANSVAKGNTSAKRAAQYAVDARRHAADELAKLAKSGKVSSSMRKKIEDVARKVSGHTGQGHGSWWSGSGSNDNPSSWI
jgi:O-acetyl-ADP-ribose deacetylase (regulator of RNase III)